MSERCLTQDRSILLRAGGAHEAGSVLDMTVTDAAAMQSVLGSEHQKSQDSGPSAPCALWPVDLKLTHLDWNPEATLIHFQGQYLTICELDYNILQTEIQNAPKTEAAVEIGEFCLVEDLTSGRWYRGRVQNQTEDLLDVFLIDHGNVLSVDTANISSCSNDLFLLPPKIVCGFLANVVLLQGCPHSVVEKYFSNLIGRDATGYIQALLPHKVLLLEIPDINMDLVKHGFGRHVDTDTFLLLVEMVTEVPLKQNIEPVPDLLIEKQRGQEFCFKPSRLQGYEDILSLCGPRLSCGTRAKVRVTAAVNPGLFYCQMTSMETDLWEMSKKLAAVCEQRAKERNHKTPENLGLLCAVNSKDEKWYRGFVQFLPVNSQVRVFIIDYGFFESVKVENVHRLPPDFDSAPIMAFSCSLFSLNDQDDEVKTQQLSFLKAGLLGRVLDVEIRSFDKEKNLYFITVIGAEDNHTKEPEPIQEPPRMNVEPVFERETKEMSPQCGYLYHETIMGEALGRTLESEEVQVGSVFVGYVEYVQNPNHFWMRTQKRNEDFEEMMTQMTDHFSQVRLDEDVLLNPALGTLCCAVYEEDMHFYRGVVTDTLDHGAEVLFVDFGNIEKVPHMLIKKIPETFAGKPPFAFCCSLVNIFPSDGIWTSNTSDIFRKAVSNRPVLVHVVQMRKNKFVVDLFEMGSDNNQSITEFLISSKEGEFWKKMQKDTIDVTGKTKTHINGNTEQWDDCGMEDKTCKHETEQAKAPVYFRGFSIEPGYELAVRCSYIVSPSDFWCQSLDKVPALEELMDKVQLYYSTHTVALQSGDSCCVAKLPKDGRWYRALITEKQNGHARVLLVDYGIVIQIEEDNLQAILPEHVYLEGQAFRCSLYNLIEPADPKNCGDWSVAAGDSLKDFVRDSTCDLRCKIVSWVIVKNKGLCNAVDLYNTQTQQSIRNLLLEQGLAQEVTDPTNQPSTVVPESFVFSSYDQSPGKEEDVYITHVSSHWEVYYHLERNTDIIEELEKKISEESKKMMQASVRPVVNNLYLAKYFDGKWYRGYAHSLPSPLHLSVFFVDYGNTNISEKTDVMLILRESADLLYTPIQAVRCSLASVSKEGHYTDVKEWLEGAILNKQVRAVIVGKSDDGSFDVELFDGEVNINEKVKELIVNHLPKPKTVLCFDASSTKSTRKTSKTKNAKTWTGQHGGRSSNAPSSNGRGGRQVGSTLQKKKGNTKKVHGKAQSKDANVKEQSEHHTKSCVPLKPQVKQQSEYHDTNTKSEQPQYTEKTDNPQITCLPDMKVTEGFRATCFVSHVDSVNSFFLQLSEDEPAILKLVEDLNSDISRDSLKTTAPLRVDDLVLAEYEEDGALYRSVVKDCEGSSGFKVEFVDYGNSAVTGKEKLYCIPEEYLSQPRLSISCSLWDSSTYKDFESFIDAVMEKPLMVDFVRQCGTHWKVKVEILDEAVGPAPLLAAVESSTETETQEEPPASSSETVESSCEQNYPRQEVSENETTKSERMTCSVENLVLEPPPANPKPPPTILEPPLKTLEPPLFRLSKLKVTNYKCQRPRTRNKSTSKRNQSKIMTSSVRAKSDCAHGNIPLTIQAKDTENCRVLSVLRNGNFYVRLNRTDEQLSALEDRIINNLYMCKVVAEDDVKQGLKCLVQVHEDKPWHRAVVEYVHQGTCWVFLVDHATRKEIPSHSIRRQCSNLTNIPNLAVLCKVNCSGLREEEGGHKSLCETMNPMVDKEVKLVFVCYSEADKLWEVEIIMTEQYLIHHTKTLPQQKEETNPSPSENGSEPAEGKSSQPEQLGFAPVDFDKAYSGFAAAVTTPFEFCVVLEDSLLVMNKVSIMLDDLPGQITPLPEAHLVRGVCCLLKSDTKNKWCRAEIAESDTTVILNLVDYGHYECMPYEDRFKLKRIPVEMTNLPKVTFPCVLRGVKPDIADGQWTDEAAVFFQECLYQKNLQIFFREFVSNTHWEVDVVVDDVHVAKKLVDAGHASYIDDMLGLRFQTQSSCKEDEVLDKKSDHHVDEADGKTALSVVSEPRQCFLM
ncbi:tudor domain-containing protein 15 isoform X1 [Larimichthys crocea]|nr:tudor domain-containing protein 15 isoform X1 [Larimichthys crocea]